MVEFVFVAAVLRSPAREPLPLILSRVFEEVTALVAVPITGVGPLLDLLL
jgi:hypothetical protein